MLSRVAETIYWLGRYVERAENIARLLQVNAHLVLDARGLAPGWESLIEITGQKDNFDDCCEEATESNVVRYLIGTIENPGSILFSLKTARENARTVREILPRNAWEVINELHWYAREHAKQGISKKGRDNYLDEIVSGAQRLTSVYSSVLYRDEAYHFLRIGYHLERTDMTTRILDVRSTDLFDEEQIESRTLDALQWISVLKSLSGYQSYRRVCSTRIRRSEVLRFLLQDAAFPRSVAHTLDAAEETVGNLGNGRSVMRQLRHLSHRTRALSLETVKREELHSFYDEIQIGVMQIHNLLAKTYFLLQYDSSQSQRQESLA